jgi:hypothetical protein
LHFVEGDVVGEDAVVCGEGAPLVAAGGGFEKLACRGGAAVGGAAVAIRARVAEDVCRPVDEVVYRAFDAGGAERAVRPL